MFNERLQPFWLRLEKTSLAPHAEKLQKITDAAIGKINQGDLSRWLKAYASLPNVKRTQIVSNQPAVTVNLPNDFEGQVELALKGLKPWRKGPFQVGNTYVDAEWRSDLKWQRLLPSLPNLHNRTVLDIGCGNGYYLMRMAENRPKLMLGIEPGLLQNVQFWSIEKYVQSGAVMLPLRIEDLPPDMCCFDVVFSMGVLYHRKSPMAHLEQLKNLMGIESELVLETLVVDGDDMTCLVPSGRYAQMRNVWFLPSVDMLMGWLKKVGFKKLKVIDVSLTTTEEQRSTEWMQFHSLSEFLSIDGLKTVEGYPPPKRAIITGQK